MRNAITILAIACGLAFYGCAGQPTSDIPESGHGAGAFSDGGYGGSGGHLGSGIPKARKRSWGDPSGASSSHSTGALKQTQSGPLYGTGTETQPVRKTSGGAPKLGLK